MESILGKIEINNNVSTTINRLDEAIDSIDDKIIKTNKAIKSIDKKIKKNGWEHRKTRMNSNKRWKHHR